MLESVLGCGEGKRRCGEVCWGVEGVEKCVGLSGKCGVCGKALGEVWGSVLGYGKGKVRCGERCVGVGVGKCGRVWER